MKFTLTTCRDFYSEEEAKKLTTLGFTFERSKNAPNRDEVMFKGQEDITVSISTMEELIRFAEKWGKIVFTPTEIEIYDGYRE